MVVLNIHEPFSMSFFTPDPPDEEMGTMKKPASKMQKTAKSLKRPAASPGKLKKKSAEHTGEDDEKIEPTGKKPKKNGKQRGDQTEDNTEGTGKKPNKEKPGKSKEKEDQKQGKKDKWAEKAKNIQISQESGEEQKEQQTHQHEQELRDEKKAYFFRKQMAKLPAEVVALFDSKTVSRADKTKLVNGVVKRDENGKFSMDLEAPVLSMLQSHYTDISGSHKAKGYPKSLMVAKLGGDLAFTKALEKGEIRETEQDGNTFYFFNTITIEKKVGAKIQTTGSVARNADDAQIGAFSAFVESFQPTFRNLTRFLQFFIVIFHFILFHFNNLCFHMFIFQVRFLICLLPQRAFSRDWVTCLRSHLLRYLHSKTNRPLALRPTWMSPVLRPWMGRWWQRLTRAWGGGKACVNKLEKFWKSLRSPLKKL